MVRSNVPKELLLYFPNLDLRIETDQIVDDSFELNESICSDTDLVIGSCEAAQFKVKVADVVADLKDQIMIVTQIVDGQYEMPLGTYKVDSVPKQADLRFKEIIAYDAMKGTDKDVSTWYNSLTFPIKKKTMMQSLLTYLGINYEEQTLQNDDVLIEKTVNPSYLKGRDVLICLCALSGGFGHITRLNKFKVIVLSGLGLYPSETLYPAEDLFPSESNEFLSAGYMESDYEEYIVEPITGIKIVEDDEDYGTMVGTDENIYTITGNFLLYGKGSNELKAIANNILLVLKNKYYRPHSTKMIGLPYIEVGDAINIITTDDAIETFVFQRTLKGIQALTDDITATGNKIRENIPSQNTEIQKLKSKTLKIVKNIDELSSTMTDIEDGLQSQITQNTSSLQTQIKNNKESLESQINQTASNITQNVTDIKNNLQGQIDVQAGNIELKVDNNGVIQAINMSKEGIKISATKLDITGIVTISDLQDNTLTINGGKIYIPVGGAVFLSQDRGNTSYGTALSINGTWDISLGNTNRSETNIYGKNYIKLYTSNESLSGYTGVVLPPNTYMRKAINSNSFGNSGGIVAIMKDLEDFVKATDISRIYSESTSSRDYYLTLNSSRALVPNYSSSYPFHLGSTSYPFGDFYIRNIYHLSGTIGFFGKTPISKKSVSAMTTSADLNTVHSKLNELIRALGSDGYGLV